MCQDPIRDFELGWRNVDTGSFIGFGLVGPVHDGFDRDVWGEIVHVHVWLRTLLPGIVFVVVVVIFLITVVIVKCHGSKWQFGMFVPDGIDKVRKVRGDLGSAGLGVSAGENVREALMERRCEDGSDLLCHFW